MKNSFLSVIQRIRLLPHIKFSHHEGILTPMLLALCTVCALLWFIGGIFAWNSYAVLPSYAELAFEERSVLGKIVGAVLPASCSSNPPTSHYYGDCPPAVKLYGGPSSQTVTATASYDSINTTITWTSTGAVRCYNNWDFGLRSTSGTENIGSYKPACEQTKVFRVRCENDLGFDAFGDVVVYGDPCPWGGA